MANGKKGFQYPKYPEWLENEREEQAYAEGFNEGYKQRTNEHFLIGYKTGSRHTIEKIEDFLEGLNDDEA